MTSGALTAATVKTLARDVGFDLVGIIAATHDSLPDWSRSVVVLGHATLDEAYDYDMWIAYDGRRVWHKPIYTVLESLAARLAHRLREIGQRAEHLTFEDSASIINLREAAVQAGLGVRGLNDIVLTRRYGPRVRWGAVFTDAPLEPDQPLNDYYCSSCTVCWGVCPTEALGPDGFDRARCLAEFEPDPAMAEQQRRLSKRPTPFTRLQCRACVDVCPVGRRLVVDTWFDVQNGERR